MVVGVMVVGVMVVGVIVVVVAVGSEGGEFTGVYLPNRLLHLFLKAIVVQVLRLPLRDERGLQNSLVMEVEE